MKQRLLAISLILILFLSSVLLLPQQQAQASNLAAVATATRTRTATKSATPSVTVTSTPTLTPLAVAPDLIVFSISLVYQVGYTGTCRQLDAPVAVKATIKNIGNADAGPFTTSMSGIAIAGLAVGQTVDVTGPYGTYYSYYASGYAVTVDQYVNQVIESNENNNTLTVPLPIAPLCTSTPTPTVDPIRPDLIIGVLGKALDPSIVYLPGSCYSASPFYDLSVEVKNIGGVAAGPFSVSVSNSGGSMTQTVSGLAAGQSTLVLFNFNSYRPLTVTVDSTNAVAESNEDNAVTYYVTSGTATSTGTQPATPRVCTATPTPSATGSTPTPTITATPSITPTFTLTTPVGTCSPVSATLAAPFTYDGAGTFCWQSSNLGSYINSWNLTSLTINGVSYVNTYVPAASYPAKVNGYWYVAYAGNYAWSHFEAK